MKVNFMPKTRLGKWSVGFGIASVVSLALSLLAAVAIGGDAVVVATVIAAHPLLSILNYTLSFTFSLASLLSFFIGILTIVKHKEWSVCKYLAVLYGLAALMFVLGEFFFPH